MLVVVYLSEAKRYTVVPEQFIYRLNERNLKNLGLNRNQSRLIYFSADVFEKLERKEVFETPIPNFNLEISTIYPLPNDLNETCFLGRLIKFEGKFIETFSSIFIYNVLDRINCFMCKTDTFEEAMSRANRLRDQLPAVYNPARVHERPIAPTQLVENEEERTENEHVDDFDGEEEEQVNTSVDMPEECIENAREPQIPPTEHINCDDEVDSTPVEQNESSTTSYISEEGIDSSQIDLKPTHLVDSEDLAAFDHLFDCHSTSSVTNEVDPLASNDLNNSSDANASNTENQMDSSEPQNVSGNSAAFLVENVQNGSVTSVNGSNESANADTLAVVHRDEQRHDDEANEQLVEEDARNEQIAANVLDLYMRGERVVLEDDLEYMYMPGQKLLAIENEPYRMKANDCLCGNRPFKETVSILLISFIIQYQKERKSENSRFSYHLFFF